MTTLLLLLAALGLVTLGAELLVRGAAALALRAGVSPLFVGLTVVGFGTSSPELFASIVAALRGAGDASVGNVVGSNVFNTALILGLTALVRPVVVHFAAVRRDVWVGLVAAGVPFLSLAFGGRLPQALGFALLAALVAWIAVAWRAGRAAVREGAAPQPEAVSDALALPAHPPAWRPLLSTAAGLALLVGGARLFVDAALELGEAAGLSERVVGLTLVAAGTSLPELVTSLVAARRGDTDIAVGNVVGSNVFNLLGVLGASAALGALPVAPAVLTFDAPALLLVSALLLPLLRTGGGLSRREGALLVLGYAVFLGLLLARPG